MTRQYFGTDGIRGTVGAAPMTPQFVMHLANAVGRVLRAQAGATGGTRPAVLIGKDTRVSGYMLESALECGFIAAGVDVTLCGPMPTPGVAYLTRALRHNLGVVISASHNPYPDNGIKFFSRKGTKLPDDWELAVEAELQNEFQCLPSAELGKAKRLDDAGGRYVEFCKSTFSNDLSLKGLKLVVDCAHGAAYQVAPATFHELGAEVIAIGNQPNGLNINDGFGATHPVALAKAVVQHGAHYGVALDGDADRLQMVDAQGRLFNGDELLYALTLDRLAQGQEVPGVVGTLMTNMAVELALQSQGIAFVRAKVGDRYVLEDLTQRGWQLGGEGSGHLLCLDKHSTGDGLISALQVLQAVVRSGTPLAGQLQGLTLFPQTLINVRLQPEQDWKSSTRLAEVKKSIEAELQGRGRVLIRASGTEPLLRVMVEAKDGALAKRCAEQLAEAVVA
jgi:phosphoglucosamine mutase